MFRHFGSILLDIVGMGAAIKRFSGFLYMSSARCRHDTSAFNTHEALPQLRCETRQSVYGLSHFEINVSTWL